MLRVALMAILCMVLVGCGANPSMERHQQLVAAIHEASDILATVNDGETAKEAKPKLVAVGEKIRDLYRTQRASKDTAFDLETVKYDKKYGKEQDELTAARDRYGKEAARVLSLPTSEGAILFRTINQYVYPSTIR